MKKTLSFILSALLVFSTCTPGLPVQALADDGDDQAIVSEATPEDPAAPVDAAQDAQPNASAGQEDSNAASSQQGEDATGAAATAASAGASVAADTGVAPASLTVVYVDGTNGNDANDGSSFDGKAVKTLAKALELQAANSAITTIFVKGSLSLDATVSIPSGVTLSIASERATITGAGNKINGIVLKSGSTLTGSGTLTMTGFKTALTSEKGSTITDGTYVFKDNATTSNSTTGISIGGAVRGSSSKGSLSITANDKSETNFYSDSAEFENCTVNVTSQNDQFVTWTLHGSWIDAKSLKLTNADMTVAGIDAGWYVIPTITNNSHLTVAVGPNGQQATGLTIQGAGNITDSTITVNGGYRAGISVGAAGKTINVTNSTLEFTNGGTGGLNVNTGTVVLSGSTIKGDGRNSGALFGAQTNGSIVFGKDCLVETPAASNSDNGAGQTGKNFVVTGGSYLVKYAPTYNSSYGSAIPTNGSDNGDEKLSLFTLADASTSELAPINKSGNAYAYSVAKASSDREKHVWVPAAKVTFKLNANDAAQQVSASYADGSTADKTSLAMRGYSLKDAKSVAGGSATLPDNPFAAGYKFLGWFYKDSDGNEQQFSDQVVVASDITVYAKWESDATTYAIKYHNGASTDETFLSTSSDPSRTIEVLSGDAVMKANPSFALEGKIFKGWTTQPDGAGDSVAAGSTLAVPAGTNVVDLYAQWEDQTVTVRFSANGGTFSDGSVFKQNPDVFEISTDERGGEVATVKGHPKVSDKTTLDALLKSLSGGSVSSSTAGIASPASTDSDAYSKIATYKYHVLDHKLVEHSLLGWVYARDYYYWFNDAVGTSEASIKGSATLTQDVTYYLKWNDDPTVERVSGDFSLPSDMWSGSQSASTSIKEVKVGDTFSLSGGIDAAGIVDQMDSLEKDIAGSQDDLSKISLFNTTSTFTATISLPDGVIVPENPTIAVSGLGDCFKVTNTIVSDHAVTVTFGLKGTYENYEQLKKAVESTGNGGLTIAAAASPSLAKPITVTVDGLSLDNDKVSNGDELTAVGSVSGTFSSYAENTVTGKVKKYDYAWGGRQIADGKDPRGDGIQQTVLVVKPVEQTLPADILVGNDTEHDGPYPVVAGQTIDFTGTIDASVVKSQMRGIESQFPGTKDYDKITLSDMSSTFTATFTLPEGLSLPDNLTKDSVRLDGFSDTFSVSDVSVSGKTVSITMKLKDGIENYAQLQKAVIDNLGDTMAITLPGVKVSDDFPAGQTATVSGAVKGSFIAHATNTETDSTKVFSFTWDGVQKPDGMDATASSVDDGILFTVACATPVASELPGDMLVGTNTEHDKVIESAQGSTFDLTGAIQASYIQDQMNKIEVAYPNANHDGIALGNLKFSFVASFTVPDGMSLPSNLDASKVTATDFGDGFKVSDVSVDGKTVKVTFALSDPDSIKTYSDLEKVVDAAGGSDGWMKLTVPGIAIDKDAAVDSNLTVVGMVEGAFSATADSASGTHKAFSFTWKGTQWPDGKDAVATDDDTIQLTVKVTKGENPNPAGPDVPDSTNVPNTGEASKKSAVRTPGMPAVPNTGDGTLPADVPVAATLGGLAILALAINIRRRCR